MLTQWWTLVTRTHTQRDSNSGNWVQQTVVKSIQNAPRWSAHHWWSQRWFLQTTSHAKPNQNQANAHLRNSVHFKSNTQKRGGGLWTAERMIAERIQKKSKEGEPYDRWETRGPCRLPSPLLLLLMVIVVRARDGGDAAGGDASVASPRELSHWGFAKP